MKYLNKIELDQKIKSLVARERELLHEILQTILVIDSRKIFLDLGFSNLFSYLTEGVGYSAGSAQRRIEAETNGYSPTNTRLRDCRANWQMQLM